MSSGDASAAVFADRSVLESEYLPASLAYREAELAALRTVLSPAIRSCGTACCLVCGPPAQGKRSAVHLASEELGRRPGAAETSVVPVECPPDATAYRMALAATNALSDGNTLAESGYSREAAFRRLRGRLRDADGTPVLRLDGVQRLDPPELEGLLAGVFDAPGDLRCAVVAIADDLAYRNALAVETRSRFDRKLYVGAYDPEEWRAIVEHRVRNAFDEHACPESVVDQCCLHAADADAPLRAAFDVLRLAGDAVAEREDRTLAIEDVDRAWSRLERERIVDLLESCSSHEQRTLAAVATVDSGRFDALYDDYRRRCEAADVTPNRERSVHNYLDALAAADLLSVTERRSSAGGRYFEYELVPDGDTVAATLDDVGDDDHDPNQGPPG